MDVDGMSDGIYDGIDVECIVCDLKKFRIMEGQSGHNILSMSDCIINNSYINNIYILLLISSCIREDAGRST